jgi:membrane protease YdiL (CAAX protease family)
LSVLPTIISAVLQVLVFLIIPFATYVATWRRVRGFLHYVGVRRCPRKAVLPTIAVVAAAAPLAASVYLVPTFRALMLAESTTAGRIATLGANPSTFVITAVVAFIQTALAEEVFFRGFLAKRLIAWLGFHRGNAVQSAIFVVPHLLIFYGPGGAPVNAAGLVLITLVATISGWLFGWLNERRGDGSIIPSWLAHGIGNTLAYTLALLL